MKAPVTGKTVAELRAALETLPDDMPVAVVSMIFPYPGFELSVEKVDYVDHLIIEDLV